MPATHVELPQRRPLPAVELSVAMEVFGLTLGLTSQKTAYPRIPLYTDGTPVRADLRRRVQGFWDGYACAYAELLVLAARAGTLFTEEPEELFESLNAAAEQGGEARLDSETVEDREEILWRLEALRTKPRLRRKYIEMLRELWDEAGGAWTDVGRRQALAKRDEVRRRIGAGATLNDLDDGSHCWKDHADAVEYILPAYFLGHWLTYFDLPGFRVCGLRLSPDGQTAELRRQTEQVALRLKALSDPTRLAILAGLAHRPRRITDVARDFSIAQPTASVHFRALREAGLVREARADGQKMYSADVPRIEALLKEARSAVLES